MNGGGVTGKPTISIGNRIITVGNGGPIVKVSSSTSIIQGPNGSVTLMVPSSSPIGEMLSPNVSVPNASTSTGKRIGTKVNILSKDRRTDSGSSKESKDITLKGDLRSIMHAFGDECIPLEESVHMMEVILRQEMEAFLFICDSAASLRGIKTLGLRECVYAMRSDQANLSRLFKYLVAKDSQQRTLRLNQVTQNIKLTTNSKSYVSEIKVILEEFDDFGQLEQLLDIDSSIENSKTKRATRADRMNQRLNNPKFVTYSKARSVSFARKLNQLQEWVTTHLHSDCKLSQTFMEVLAFLIYEKVAQIVDLAFIIKRERMGSSDPIQRLNDTRGVNPDTCMSAPAFQKKRKDEECNSVSEILVQASELEAKRLKKIKPSNNNEVLVIKGVHNLSPCEIREAYLRIQRSPPPSASYLSRAERIRQLHVQY